MSEVTNNGRKKLVIILVAAIAVLALVLGLCIFFAGNQSAEPTDPTQGTGSNVPTPTDPPEKTGLWHCICGTQTEQHLTGCDGTEVQWTEWTATDALPITSGNYYLTADVTLLTADNVADVKGEQTIRLDLNGHTVNSETRVYRLNDNSGLADLTLLDSVGTGKVIMTKHPNGASLVLIGYANVFTVYGGTYDGSALTSMGESGIDAKNGGLIRGDGKGNVINIHGGTFIGVKASNSGGVLFAQNGTFTMTGGEMMNGFGNNGGNIHVRQTDVTISGGKIHNGTATLEPNGRGGNIFINVSKVTISGTAEIYDGKAVYLGNNIFHNDGSTLEVTGGKVYMTGNEGDAAIYPVLPNPEDPNHMACICGSSNNKHKPGCDGTKYAWRPWTNSGTLPATSGKYYLAVDVKVGTTVPITGNQEIFIDLNGHKISSDTRIYLINPAKCDDTLTILDTTGKGKVVMTKFTEGATFAAIGNTGNKKLVIYGGTFDASAVKADANGGFVRIGSETSSMEMHGGTIIGAASANNGGSVFIAAGAKFTMTGGEIKNGHANNGGNVVLNAGAVFKMTGGKIHHGTAAFINDKNEEFGRGGNIFVNGAKLEIGKNAQVYDGTVNYRGENIFYNTGSELNIKGKVYLTGSDFDGIYPIPAADADEGHKVCICGSATDAHLPGCDGTKYAWSPWTVSSTLPSASGKYYLDCDITLEEAVEITGNEAIYIDLNGHTITSSVRAYLNRTTNSVFSLTLLDSVGTGKMVGTETNTGRLLATIITKGEKVVTIYGGTYDTSAMASTNNGALISAHDAECVVNIHGGTFIGPKSSNIGGIVVVENGALNITGGELMNGTAQSGGNVYVKDATFTMTGGKIHGGVANGSNARGGNIFNNGSTINISGTAEIYDGTAASGANIHNMGEYTYESTGNVYLTGSSSTGVFPEVIDVPDEVHTGCICGSNSDNPADHKPGCDGTKHEWTAWDKADALPNTPGYYKLFHAVHLSAHADVKTAGEIYLDLNGQTITVASGVRVYNISQTGMDGAKLTILDSNGQGVIDLTGANNTGSLVALNLGTNHVFTMYGGTVDGSGVSVDNNGTIIRNINQTVYIHGGKIIGGTSTNKNGGAIQVQGTGKLYVTGGEIYGGKAVNGGNIAIDGGTFELTGGKIYDGTASQLGHNIYIADGATFVYDPDGDAEVYLTGSEFTGIHPDPKPPVHTGCICGSNSENIADHKPGCDGTMHTDWQAWMSTTGLPVNDGKYYLTGNVTIKEIQVITEANANIVLDLNGKTVSFDPDAPKNVRVYNMISSNPYDLTILDSKGTAVIDLGERETAGALVALHQADKTFTLYGGTINGSKVVGDNHGAIIRNIGHVVNIHGGTIIGGTGAGKNGGAINVSAGGTLNMTAGTIKGGSAVNGGNIMMEDGTLNLTGGNVIDGTCVSNGANIYIASASEANCTIAPEATVGFTDPSNTFTGIYPNEVTTKYTVVHMLQNIDNDEYGIELVIEQKAGMAGTTTLAAALTDERVNGFTAKAFEQTTIADDGNTIVTIYYDRNSYTVTWLAQDGTTVLATGPVKFGAALTAPDAPAITDYVFTGWNPTAPATMPAENVTFTAQYIYGKLVEVTFNSNGGSAVAPQEFEENGLATLPTAPTKLYSTFAGWYTDETLTNAWDFNTPVADDMVLYAKWTDAVEWTLWGDDEAELTTLPTLEGNYKLVAPITVSAEISLGDSAVIVIDLNGQTVTGNTGTSIYRFAAPSGETVEVSIWDSTTTGTINLTGTRLAALEKKSANSWMGVYTLNIQGGTINGGTFTTDHGAMLKVSGADSVVNISGGTINGGITTGSYSGGVAMVNSNGTLNMTGGVVCGGEGNNGGNFICQENGKIIISGGEIYGGTARSRGGNIFVSAHNSNGIGICVINGDAKIYDGIAPGTAGNTNQCQNIFVVKSGNGKVGKLLTSLNPDVAYDVNTISNVYLTADPTNDGIWISA